MEYSKGLAGVVAGETVVSQVQGDVGKLIYKGISIDTLASQSTFEESTYHALYGVLPTQAQLSVFRATMAANRALPVYIVEILKNLPKTMHPMGILQTLVSSLTGASTSASLSQVEQNIEQSISIIAKMGTMAAYASRHRKGLPFVEPKTDLSHAGNFLYMLSGVVPSAEMARIFDVALILHLDHDFNASTFTARVTSSTQASLNISIASAIGSLAGPLHGGANEKVLQMADEIGESSKAKQWVLDALAKKAKVNGFGHRVYKTMDPRAVILKGMLDTVVSAKPNKYYDILNIVHDTMIAELGKTSKDYIWPNVDFWSGALYNSLEIDTLDFTPIFTVSRVSGWCAHILEQWQDNRIFRPAAFYIGPDSAEYIPITAR
jgi:citrate synthase